MSQRTPIRLRFGWADSLIILGVGILLFAWCIPYLANYDIISDVHPSLINIGPSFAHPLGTDHLGRDVMMRLLLASQAFVLPGLLACVTACLLAIPFGAMAGFYGGWISQAIRYPLDIVSSLPRFVLVLLICSIYGDNLVVLAVGAALAYVPTFAAALHERVAGFRSSGHVQANRAHGVPEWKNLWYHVVWAACRHLIMRHILSLFVFFLILETTLSYLGQFGVQQPNPSWGNMLSFDWGQAGAHPASFLAPVVAIWLSIGLFTMLRARMRDS